MTIRLQGQGITEGNGEGIALVSRVPIAFNLGVDERTDIVVEKGHELEGQSVAGRVLIFPGGKGSTASSFSLLQLAALGRGPVALVNIQSDAIIAAGAVLASIPLVHRCAENPVEVISSGDRVHVNGTTGTVEVLEASR